MNMPLDLNLDDEYTTALDRSMTIQAILTIDKRFNREYLNTLNLVALHELEDSCLNNMYEIL